MKTRTGWIAVLWLLAVPAPAAAQGTNPLLKSDIVRLLSSRSLSMAEVADLVRRNCLAFRPTERDLEDFRDLGAPSTVMESIDECGRRAPADGANTREPAGEAYSARVNPSRVVLSAGEEAAVAVSLQRGGRIQTGRDILLRGNAGPPGAPPGEMRAQTDGDGVAMFRFRATAAGTYTRNLVVPGAPAFQGDRRVTIVVQPVEPSSIDAQPARLESDRVGAETEIRVRVRDRYGNAAAGRRVRLEPRGVEARVEPSTDSTGAEGLATFRVRLDDIRGPGSLAVFVSGNMLGRIPVAAGRADAERTGFIAGVRQSGAAGARLDEPLVLVVRDAAGLPVPDQDVVIGAENATAEPREARTDENGRIELAVELGTRAGVARVEATIGEIRDEVELWVLPGPAAELRIERAGAIVDGRLALEGTEPVSLTVRVLDEFGNPIPGADLAASVTDPGVLRMEVRRGDPSGGAGDGGAATVRIVPRGGGSTELMLRAGQARQSLPVDIRILGSRRWGVSARANFVAFDYFFWPRPEVRGEPGFAFDVQGRFGLNEYAALRAGFTLGSLGAERPDDSEDPDLPDISESAMVRAASVGVDITPIRFGQVSPVLTLGLGRIQLETDEVGRGIKHTGVFWEAGTGLDVVLGPNFTGELRMGMQRATDLGIEVGEQDIAWLYPIGVGVRIGL